MIKLINVVGARPQIIKAAAISRAIATSYQTEIEDVVVHTGQHYDANMSGDFFSQLNIPQPKYNLECGSLSHAKQTALIMNRFEDVLLKEKPHFVLVYGDTNSTVAASLTAIKMNIPVVHIEAGLRSFNKRMPEEVNRIMCDHISTLLFCPTKAAIQNLLNEGINHHALPANADKQGVFHCGDIMYDNSLYYSALSSEHSTILKDLNLTSDAFILFTMHRDLNTDNKSRLKAIISSVVEYTKQSNLKIVFPVHPRTHKMVEGLLDAKLKNKLFDNPKIILSKPLNFFDIIQLEANCKLIVTDSGGVQKEAFFFKKPCIVLRPETEWIELVNGGNAILADADNKKILSCMLNFPGVDYLNYPPLYGDGHAAEFICNKIIEQHKTSIN
ncbi:non-hydrolyzing UDP-N-acetylglucosamine 2-epimerase [Carboxylicivirga linearis]|uniref:UDP-N-acetylglucosamine 2-epimerase (Non-hydrolyzing) n=1 Tax=Carboxylicivirga linearis TaxID=1628157 RepID=A0ABS5JWL8_9BACT|nr:UDP-N-acetylglucosamine 2-epimerase (non-hydrolyzing) [Carboxylicivirga linearis]MBS2098741.1 UDP-N-acetylglucosamine 2-epimerase (non-hydrolyzing) [Carboxylicivirga linearis]